MPPQRDEIWKNYLETKNATGITVKATCKHCGQEYAAPNATRMRRHILESCKKCPPIVRDKVSLSNKTPKTSSGDKSDKRVRGGGSSTSTDANDPDEPSVPEKPSTSTGIPGTSNTQQNSAKRQKLMFENYFDRITKEEKDKLDEHFARAVYSKGLPLSTFEGPHMRNAFEALRPAYQPPSRKLLSDRLLEAEYNRAMSQNHDIIDKALCLTLITDGWTNRRGEGIINFIVGTPEPVFLKSTEPGSEKENAPFIYKELTNVMEKVGAHRVFLITTDNAKVMKAACKMIQECYPHVYFIGCGSHSFNLLFKDILRTSFFKTLLSQCLTIIKIRKKRQLYAYFKEKQHQLYGEKKANLILPSPTRFCGAYFVFTSLKKNKQALQETVLVEKEGLVVPDDLRSIVIDNAFWSKLSYAVEYLQSLAQGTHLIESDNAKLSETVAISMNVKHDLSIFSDQCPIPSRERDEICEAVNHRIKNFCVTKLHLAAYLVDPFFAGKGLSDEECLAGIAVIGKIANFLNLNSDDVIENLADFKTRSNYYDNDVMWSGRTQVSDPVKWWNFFCNNQPLRPVATRLLSLVPTTASSERVWSSYEHVHSKKRNRLANSRVEKLVVVRSNLRLELRDKGSSDPPQMIDSAEKRREIMSSYEVLSLFGSEIDSDSDTENDDEGVDYVWSSDDELQVSSSSESEDNSRNIIENEDE